jgi:HSP20 family molecular chaperone IbpA
MARSRRKIDRRGQRDIDTGRDTPNLWAVFKEISKMIHSAAKSQRKGKSEFSRTGKIKGLGAQEARVAYGFAIELGRLEGELPRADILDETGRIVVVVKISGLKKDKIRTKLKDNILEIVAEDSNKEYHEEITLPSKVNKKPLRSTYRNGFLTITLSKEKK